MVKKENFRKLLMIIIGMTIVFVVSSFFNNDNLTQPSQSSYLIDPLSDKMILITSAGQSTDAYILQDLANELRLNNLFMPETTSLDIDDLSAIIMVVGYSDIGLRLHNRNFEKEYLRVKSLITHSQDLELPVITIFIGGKERRNEKTDMLLELACSNGDYIITTTSGNYDNFISDLAEKKDTPISFIENIKELTKPLASIFR